MTRFITGLDDFFQREPRSILCELVSVAGSSPRDIGTSMMVGERSLFGTIGGGALEYLVIGHARRFLAGLETTRRLDIPLGPEIGQCCGGRVEVSLSPIQGKQPNKLSSNPALTKVFIFGSGHVGRALARVMATLPVKVEVIDSRQNELDLLPADISSRRSAIPEAVIRSAPLGSVFIVVTHDHALDFLLTFEALKREDSPYIGMIGSKSKKAKFRRYFLDEGGLPERLNALVLPIGAQGVGDKRPEVIAVHTASEMMSKLHQYRALPANAALERF